MNEKEQIRLVKYDPDNIKEIENPSEAVQLAAVKRNGYAIRHIENPSEKVQLAAVQQNGNALRFIKNPSEAVQLQAVKQDDGGAIQYIENPSEAVQLAAVKQSPEAIEHIDKPSKKVLDLVKQNQEIESNVVKYVQKWWNIYKKKIKKAGTKRVTITNCPPETAKRIKKVFNGLVSWVDIDGVDYLVFIDKVTESNGKVTLTLQIGLDEKDEYDSEQEDSWGDE